MKKKNKNAPANMKVCHLTSMHDWDDDRIYQRACLGLKRSGLEVALIASGKRDVDDGVNHIVLKTRKGIKRRLLSTFQAFRASLSLKDHVLHFHDPEFLPYVFLYRMLGYKIVFDSHEVFSVRFYQWKGIPQKLRPLAANTFFWIEARFMRRFHALIVTSDSMSDMYAKHNKRVEVIRNLHSIEVLKKVDIKNANEKWKNPIIYTSGVIGPDRHSDKMLLAFSKIANKYPTTTLRYAGWYTGDYKNHLLSKAKELGVSNKVECLDAVPYLEQFERTTEATIGFVLLKNSRKNKVASSNRLFEYMYCELPLIVEDTVECRRVIEDSGAGILVDSTNEENLIAVLENLLSNPNRCWELGLNGRKAVMNKYHFEKDLGVLTTLYTEITK